ncbi:MAG: translation initiation factor IF-3 [Gammaproteobacteria bacterium]|nr:translation initiation factor IF-3 [Gammaproteobacteria bacterium]
MTITAKTEYRINEEITARTMRVVGPEGEQVGILSREDALRMAEEAGVDLVEIAPQADPPVCRVMDYGKHLFEESKRKTSARKRQQQVQVKEMKFRPATGEGDYQVKLRKLVEFITEGDKAKVTLMFRGREMAHQELGIKLLRRVEADLAEIAKVEQFPRLEGRFMTMMLGPKK